MYVSSGRPNMQLTSPQGMVIAQSLDHTDPWPTRVAIALAFQQLAPSFPATQVELFFRFLIQDEALGDRSSDVRREMLQAGMAIIDHHGESQRAGLLSAFETHLAGPNSANETGDQIKEAVVILFGRAALHLAASRHWRWYVSCFECERGTDALRWVGHSDH